MTPFPPTPLHEPEFTHVPKPDHAPASAQKWPKWYRRKGIDEQERHDGKQAQNKEAK